MTSRMQRIATGVYRHERGYQARVSISVEGRTITRQRLFPPDTPLAVLTAWREQARRAVRHGLDGAFRTRVSRRLALPASAGWIKAAGGAPMDHAIGALWQVQKDWRRATANVWRHPEGLELRIARGRQAAAARVFSDSRTLFETALVTLERFKARGWSVIES